MNYNCKLYALPLNSRRFIRGPRRNIYELVKASPGTTIKNIAEELNLSPSLVAANVSSLVADFKLRPDDYNLFNKKSSISGIKTAVGEWTVPNRERYCDRVQAGLAP